MRPLLEGLIVCLTLLILLAVFTSPPITQADFEFPLLWDNPSFLIQPFQVTTREKTFNGEGDIIVDNFEYLDSPSNHVWIRSEEYEGGFTKNSEVRGWRFRLDNHMFRAKAGGKFLDSPDLFEMGPLYAQIFEPYRYLFIADSKGTGITVFDKNGQEGEINQITDLMLNPDNFLLVQDPNDPNDRVVRYWIDEMGANPKLFGENDPNVAKIFDRDSFLVDLSLPIFADSDLRMRLDGPGSLAKTIIDSGTLYWYATVSGYGANVVDPCGFLQPLPVNPYDGMPTYLPARYSVIDVIKAYGKPYYSPENVHMLEGALWNSGITVWPNIATLVYTPHYFEDLIVTLKVTNWVDCDVRTFPICVVNYPVENYPPVLQLDIRDQIFYVDEFNEYAVNLIDPDCFIFSMSSVPPSTHVPGFPISEDYRTDMEGLYWGIEAITINGQISTLPDTCSYSGPWCGCDIFSSLMDDFDYCHFRHTGLIQFTPQSEKILGIEISASDLRGGNCFSELEIICMSWSDADEDGIHDSLDNCPFLSNPSQLDSDEDDIGDECDICPEIPDPNQDDLDSDGVGDLCDNCPGIPNTDQLDDDKDNKGDVCDPCPSDPNDDEDGDGWCDDIDNCPYIWNTDQEDTDIDGLGNTCDNCPEYSNPDQVDLDGDGIGDACDNCPEAFNPDQVDSDGNNTGDACDTPFTQPEKKQSKEILPYYPFLPQILRPGDFAPWIWWQFPWGYQSEVSFIPFFTYIPTPPNYLMTFVSDNKNLSYGYGQPWEYPKYAPGFGLGYGQSFPGFRSGFNFDSWVVCQNSIWEEISLFQHTKRSVF